MFGTQERDAAGQTSRQARPEHSLEGKAGRPAGGRAGRSQAGGCHSPQLTSIVNPSMPTSVTEGSCRTSSASGQQVQLRLAVSRPPARAPRQAPGYMPGYYTGAEHNTVLPQQLSGAPGLKAPLTGRGSARWSVTELPSISDMRLVNVSRLFLQHVETQHCQLSGYLFVFCLFWPTGEITCSVKTKCQ
jgi:hypothetical protein